MGTPIEEFISPDINLNPDLVHHPDGAVKHPGLDNYGMGTVFEEPLRCFKEEKGGALERGTQFG